MESAYGSSLAPAIDEITGIIVHDSDHQNPPQNCSKLKRLKIMDMSFSTSLLSKRCFYLFQGHKEKLNATGDNDPQSRVAVELWNLRCSYKEF